MNDLTAYRQDRGEEGFTLAELLIAVAIILVLVAIAIPVFSGVTEKSREATDVANIRSALAEVKVLALQNDQTSHYENGQWSSGPITLEQQEEGWQDADAQADLKGFGTVEGEPLQNGSTTATVRVTRSETGVSTVIYFAPSWSRFSPSAGLVLPEWVDNETRTQLYGGDDDLTADEQKLVNELKKQFGWDAVTVDTRYLTYSINGQNRRVLFMSCVPENLKSSSFATNGSYSGQTTAYRIAFDPDTHEVLKVVSEGGKWGYNGSHGVGFWGNKTPVVEYEKH